MLVVDGMGTHVSKAYIYFAMAFSLLVELVNMRYRRRHARG
jgi:predicted tellurium resistance membrane protein TerC